MFSTPFPLRPKYHVPRSQFNTPPYYPQVPLSRLNSPTLFAQLDVETLFYVFYYLPGTYQQSVLPCSVLSSLTSLEIPRSSAAEKPVMALPREIPDMVPAAFGATGNNRRVRAGCVCLLRLGRELVPAQEERFPFRVSLSV